MSRSAFPLLRDDKPTVGDSNIIISCASTLSDQILLMHYLTNTVNQFGSEAGIFGVNLYNIMAVDVLVHHTA